MVVIATLGGMATIIIKFIIINRSLSQPVKELEQEATLCL
jgi:hypothetical protein